MSNRGLRGSRRNKFAFCCAARRGAILSVLTNRNRSMIEQPTLAPECEVISTRALSRREFFATAGGAFAATMAAIPQVVKALPAAATSLGKVKIRDIKTAQIMARYPFNLVKIETDSGSVWHWGSLRAAGYHGTYRRHEAAAGRTGPSSGRDSLESHDGIGFRNRILGRIADCSWSLTASTFPGGQTSWNGRDRSTRAAFFCARQTRLGRESERGSLPGASRPGHEILRVVRSRHASVLSRFFERIVSVS